MNRLTSNILHNKSHYFCIDTFYNHDFIGANIVINDFNDVGDKISLKDSSRAPGLGTTSTREGNTIRRKEYRNSNYTGQDSINIYGTRVNELQPDALTNINIVTYR